MSPPDGGGVASCRYPPGTAVRSVLVMHLTDHLTSSRHRLGLPVWALLALSLLAAPRVVLHDQGTGLAGPVAGLLAIGPAVVWIAVVVWSRARSPLLALLVVGLGYGVVLAVVHNLFWEEAFADEAPQLGGNLEGQLSGEATEVLLRGAMTLSSVFTGAAVGLVCGLVATLLRTMLDRHDRGR
jgi:hypothetical protein